MGLSDARILDRVVFQGGTALRLCYRGERYSEDLDFVCGANASYVTAAEFGEVVQNALSAATRILARNFGLGAQAVHLKSPENLAALRQDAVSVAAWQIRIPVEATARAPQSFVKVEFANVPSYDNGPAVVANRFFLPDVPDIILRVEQPAEILADKAIALTARPVFKHRDIWDVWFLRRQLGASVNRSMIEKKFSDYKTANPIEKAQNRIEVLADPQTESEFMTEMSRFLPKARVGELGTFSLPKIILAEAAAFLREAVLPA